MHSKNILPQMSWKKVNLFQQCRRCFYKEHVLQMKRPGIDADSFSLNNAVDVLWKNEFDVYRAKQIAHPIMLAHKINAVPFNHELVFMWRDYKAGGIRFVDQVNGLELYGIIDDIWINESKELIIVDYKATAKHKQFMTWPNKNKWDDSNKRQMAFYAALLKRSGHKIYNKGYFVYSTALKDKPLFNQKLEFESCIKDCPIDDSWMDSTMRDLRYCLDQPTAPEASKDCEFCKYELNQH